MRYEITGIDQDSGDSINIVIEASSEADARSRARRIRIIPEVVQPFSAVGVGNPEGPAPPKAVAPVSQCNGVTTQWYYTIKGQQVGPLSTEQLKAAAAAGDLMATDLIWNEGLANSNNAADIHGLFEHPRVPSAPTSLSKTVTPSMPIRASQPPASHLGWWIAGIGWLAVIAGIGWLMIVFLGISLEGFGASREKAASKKTDTTNSTPAKVDIGAMTTVAGANNQLENALVHDFKAANMQGDDDCDALAARIDSYVTRAKGQEGLAQCPGDFSEAYLNHVNAWADMALILGAHPHIRSNGEAAVEGFLRGMCGDPTGGAFEMKAESDTFKQKLTDAAVGIEKTKNAFQTIAFKYGATSQ